MFETASACLKPMPISRGRGCFADRARFKSARAKMDPPRLTDANCSDARICASECRQHASGVTPLCRLCRSNHPHVRGWYLIRSNALGWECERETCTCIERRLAASSLDATKRGESMDIRCVDVGQGFDPRRRHHRTANPSEFCQRKFHANKIGSISSIFIDVAGGANRIYDEARRAFCATTANRFRWLRAVTHRGHPGGGRTLVANGIGPPNLKRLLIGYSTHQRVKR